MMIIQLTHVVIITLRYKNDESSNRRLAESPAAAGRISGQVERRGDRREGVHHRVAPERVGEALRRLLGALARRTVAHGAQAAVVEALAGEGRARGAAEEEAVLDARRLPVGGEQPPAGAHGVPEELPRQTDRGAGHDLAAKEARVAEEAGELEAPLMIRSNANNNANNYYLNDNNNSNNTNNDNISS